MIKRWIARRRRRLDLYGRVRAAEARLAAAEQERLSRSSHEADGQVELRSLLGVLSDRIEQSDAEATSLQREIRRLGDALANWDHLHDRIVALEDRTVGRDLFEDLERRVADRLVDYETRRAELPAIVATLEAGLGRLNIRAARLETQRQVDVEEARHLSLTSLQELKRRVLEWRQAEVIARIDRALPSRRYIGRPSEERPTTRLTPTLANGVRLGEIVTSEKLIIAPLARDGSPSEISESDRVADLEAGGWIVFAPQECLVPTHFERLVMDHIARMPEAEILYADDIAVDTEEAVDQVRLKPEFDLTLLMAQDYVGSPLIVKASALKTLGGLNPSMGTAACADLLFRAHAAGMTIRRIPEVLLAHPGKRVRASAADYKTMLEAQPQLEAHDVRPGAALETFSVERRFMSADIPAVTLIIPTRRTRPSGSSESYVERLLGSIAATDWPIDKLAVIIGDDQTGEPEWSLRPWPFALRRIETPRAPGEPFNYAAKMNRLWRAAETEQIVFLNDDVRAIDGGWLKALQTFAVDPTVGGVGARLLFEDGSLQHAGMAPHNGGSGTVHLWVQRMGSKGIYQNWALVHREWSMVTGAVFATRRSLMEQVSGFDERFSLEFNDTDLSMRLRKAGYRIVYTPHAQMVHVERASRGGTPPPQDDAALFNNRWSAWLANDPSWHPQLDLTRIEVMPAPNPDAWYL